METITLQSKRALTDSLFELVFERPQDWSYQAGQFARLGLPQEGDEPIFRAYSMSSTPEEKTLSFLIKCVQDGQLSPRLTSLEVGESVLLDGDAQGNLLPERIPGGEVMWFFATGAGLAPFLGLLKEKTALASWPRIVLALSARTLAEANALSALATATRHPALMILPATTRETSTLQGRLPALLESGVLEERAGARLEPDVSRAMLCGNPDFIKDMRALLKTRSMVSPRFGKPGQLLVESLW